MIDDGELFLDSKKMLKILNFIHLTSTFAVQAVSSTGSLEVGLPTSHEHCRELFNKLSPKVMNYISFENHEEKYLINMKTGRIFACSIILIQGVFFTGPYQITCKSLQKSSKYQNFLRFWHTLCIRAGP